MSNRKLKKTWETKQYDVKIQYEGDGWWFAECGEFAGCHTQGKGIRQTMKRIAEVIEMCIEEELDIEISEPSIAPEQLVLKYVVDDDFLGDLLVAQQARAEALEAEARAQERTRVAAQRLHNDAGISTRDVGHMLGLSGARISQLLDATG